MFLIFRADLTAHVELQEHETRHARARRLTDGAAISLGDGLGRRVRGQLTSLRTAQFDLTTVETQFEPSRILYSAVPEPSRMEWLLQKGTELGMTAFVPVRFVRSENRSVRDDRARRIIEEAAVQSRRFVLPRMHPLMDLADACKVSKNPIVLLPEAEKLLETDGSTEEISFFVGPEGGFSPDEISLLSKFSQRRLSRTILRVETAAICALSRCLL
jgi:16S rRNA (uracil1498-N3)-methyltransferase